MTRPASWINYSFRFINSIFCMHNFPVSLMGALLYLAKHFMDLAGMAIEADFFIWLYFVSQIGNVGRPFDFGRIIFILEALLLVA